MNERERVLNADIKNPVEFVFSYMLASLVDTNGRFGFYDIMKERPSLIDELDEESLKACYESANKYFENEYKEDLLLERKLEIVAERLIEELTI